VEIFTVENLLALVTLTSLEIVLGIDNIVFIAILSSKLPPEKRNRARRLGLLGAMLMRIALLLSITWIMGLTKPLFEIAWLGEHVGRISGKDLILFVGGLFLIGKATHEIHSKLEGEDPDDPSAVRVVSMASVIVQIMLMDIIFSLDSVITAVGMVEQREGQPAWQPLSIMITAVVIAVIVMMVFARSISDFVERHPTVKMLALSFLILIGVMLVADSFEKHIPKGYIYFAMAFSLFVELLNLRMRKVSKLVHIHQPHMPRESKSTGA
jgi:predicted tellurium resistance membrane protein TerC